ncbi:hypothetical protein [Amycolatopsis sp. NPDC051372]|uniref:hypothetical protein n=1 Tax=Amycolatopsis sp. NPDC051372 TaxID=3155669 RepID=UPI00341C8DFC
MFTEFLTGAALLSASLVAPGDVGWSLWPSEVAPGGEMHVETYAAQGNGCNPAGPVTSPGFAAPIPWPLGGNWGHHGGTGTAATRPGTYTATFPCTDGRVATATFTVAGTPPSSVTPRPSSPSKPRPTTTPVPEQDQPQVSVRPAGAPQTGGGGLAVSFTE